MAKDNWLLKGFVIAIVSAIAAFLVQHYGESILNNIENLVKSFLITFSPVIVGLLAFFIYWIIADYIKLRRFNGTLERWIGYFTYPDKKGGYLYTDLKGKIKRYIQEELEMEAKNRIEVDTGIMERVSHLTTEVEDLRNMIPKKAIGDKPY